MNSKITLPKEVAEAIAHYTDLADSKHEAFTDILSLGYEAEKSELILRYFDGNYDELMEVLICGYAVAFNPEEFIQNIKVEYEKAKEEYERLGEYENEYYAGVMDGIEVALNFQGIQIAGVNA